MTLSEAQMQFVEDVVLLVEYATDNGYRLTYGWAYRPEEYAMIYAALKKGAAHSIHELKLGIDFQLFKDGIYLTASEDYAPLGTYWKSIRPENRWGGDFDVDKTTPGQQPDGNHFSREWGGRA